MGGTKDVIRTIVDPIQSITVEIGDRVGKKKPVLGQSITDPTGAKAAAKAAANAQAAQSAAEAAAQAELQKKLDDQRRAEAAAATRGQSRALSRLRDRGMRSTILTSPLGLVDSPTGTQKTLLGS